MAEHWEKKRQRIVNEKCILITRHIYFTLSISMQIAGHLTAEGGGAVLNVIIWHKLRV